MKIVEQTSTQLILKDSARSAWTLRVFASPFLIVGLLGLWLVISEKTLPSFFIIFCLIFGIWGVFWTSSRTVYLDKPQNQFVMKIERILGTKEIKSPLQAVSASVKKTAFLRKKRSSFFVVKKEPIYIVALEIASTSQKITLSGNYSWTREEAVEMAHLINNFLNLPS